MLKGSIVALITPLKNGVIDIEAFKALVKHQITAQTKGLVLCGSTGEGGLLSLEERKMLFHTAKTIVGSSLPLIVGCSHFQYDALLALIDPDYEYILVTPPPYIKPSQEAIVQFYTKLYADTQTNIIVYNNPARCGVDISLETMKTLLSLPRMHLKDSNPDLERVSQLAYYRDHKSLLCGEDTILWDYCLRGGNGAISVVGNIIPELLTAFFETPTPTKEVYHQIQRYVSLLNLGGNPSAIKGLMSLKQLCQNEVRFPLLPLSGEPLNQMKGMLHDIQNCDKKNSQSHSG